MFGYGNDPLRCGFCGDNCASTEGSSLFTNWTNWPTVMVVRALSGSGAPIGRTEQGTPNAPYGQVEVLPPITRTPDPPNGPVMSLVKALAASVFRAAPGGSTEAAERSL